MWTFLITKTYRKSPPAVMSTSQTLCVCIYHCLSVILLFRIHQNLILFSFWWTLYSLVSKKKKKDENIWNMTLSVFAVWLNQLVNPSNTAVVGMLIYIELRQLHVSTVMRRSSGYILLKDVIVYWYIYIYIQGVPGRMCQTSGECSLR